MDRAVAEFGHVDVLICNHERSGGDHPDSRVSACRRRDHRGLRESRTSRYRVRDPGHRGADVADVPPRPLG